MVYVSSLKQYGANQWCFMFSDQIDCEELISMARKIGLDPESISGVDLCMMRYDVRGSEKRKRAIELGAKEVEPKELVETIRRKRQQMSVQNR